MNAECSADDREPKTDDRHSTNDYSFGSTIPFCDWYFPFRSA
jgi:hypothetical protein